MRARSPFLSASLLVLGACAGGGPASPAGLAYAVPDPAAVTYMSGDTATMDIDAGGQSMQARVQVTKTLGASFARAADGVQVTLTVEDLDGRMSNPAGPAVTADEKAVDGPLVFTLDRKGSAEIVSQPKVSQAGQTFVQPLVLAHSFFPRLPGRGVSPGDSWTDTVSVDGPQGEGTVSATTVVTYTAVGDTVVGGRSLLRIDMTGDTDQTASGLIAGMDFSQTAKGKVSGWVLWDMRRGLMVETFTDSDLRGSMDVSAAPFPLGMRVRERGHVKLAEGM